MKPEQAARLLGETQFFAGLDDGALAKIAAEGHERTYKKGSRIFHQGEPGDAFYVIAEGTVKVVVSSGKGDEMVLVTMQRPDVLGEVSLLDEGRRSAAAEALEATTLLAFARSTVLDLMHREPAITDALLRSVGGMLRRLTMQAADFVFLDLEGRVAKLLVQYAERSGEEREDGIALDLGITQTDLASMVGGSRQSVNQILHALGGREFLSLEGRHVVITDLESLRRRAGMS